MQLLGVLKGWNEKRKDHTKVVPIVTTKLHRFLYEELRIIKLEIEPVRSINLERLYCWYLTQRKQNLTPKNTRLAPLRLGE